MCDFMKQGFAISVVACCLSLIPNGANAQDVSGLFGTWAITGKGTSADPSCGASNISGTARIFQRVTNEKYEMYQGRMVSSITFDYCDEPLDQDMVTILYVDGDRVMVTFEDENRSPYVLEIDGRRMYAEFPGLGFLRMDKIADASDTERAEEVRASISQQFYDDSSQMIRDMLRQRQKDEGAVEGLLWQYFDARASCKINSMLAVTTEQSLSFYEIVNLIDPKSFGAANSELMAKFDRAEYRSRESVCFKAIDNDFGLIEGG